MRNFEIIVGIFGGVGLFLYGMKLMGDGLENAAGDKLKTVLEKLTTNRLLGVLLGALVTAVIQSSAATTVMAVSFVNAGLMTLMQAVGVIMGANIGTTITAQIVSFDFSAIAPLIIGVGAIVVLFSRKKRTKDIAHIALGFGLLFLGLGMMTGSMKPLANEQWFIDLIIVIGNNVFLGIIVGMLLTALIQSSSAITGVLVALATAGAIDMTVALPVILGSNIGTCITAMLSSIGTSRTAKKAALIHLFFNIIGIVLVLPILNIFITFVQSMGGTVARQVANAHTLFNVSVTIAIFPFAKYLVKLVNIILPGEDEKEQNGAIYLDKNLLETPSVAFGQVVKETVRMANISKKNLELSIKGFLENDEDSIKLVYQNEKIINNLEKEITDYLIELSQLDLPIDGIKRFAPTYHAINDIERIGDHAENIADLSSEKLKHKIDFGDEAIKEVKLIYEKTIKALEFAISSYENRDSSDEKVIEFLEDEIDSLEKEFRNNNLKRLNEKACSANSSVVFLDLISNLERIGDHANNIGKL